MKDTDSCQMGPTGREGLSFPFCRANTKNGWEDENVGDEDDGERTREVGISHREHGSLCDISIRAGQD